jgi:uncharacterized membrane protein
MATFISVFLAVALVFLVCCYIHIIVAEVRAKKYKVAETREIRDNTDDNQ